MQQFVVEEGQVRWRESKELPPASLLIHSPYDVEARYSIKRETLWTGYKAHLTETCDAQTPNLITHVQTTVATTQDCEVTETIHADLAQADLLPATHFADEGYVDALLRVDSQKEHGIELLGPVARDSSWQARAQQGFDQSHFTVDWETQQVTCPRGKPSLLWMPQKDGSGKDVIQVKFSPADCQACEVRSLCTRSKIGRRELVLHPKEQYLALHSTRAAQKTSAFQKRYSARAGIEGTLSQAVVCGWVTPFALYGTRQDPLAERGHCDGAQCASPGRLVRGSASRENTNLPLRPILRAEGCISRGSLNNSPTTSPFVAHKDPSDSDACVYADFVH